MLARTHGQSASPTFVGKEFMVFSERLYYQLEQLNSAFSNARIKFGGATGNLNAHYFSYGNIDWIKWSDQFIKELGFKRARFTTQIDHYDMMGSIFD